MSFNMPIRVEGLTPRSCQRSTRTITTRDFRMPSAYKAFGLSFEPLFATAAKRELV
jgi:hypothetical protein